MKLCILGGEIYYTKKELSMNFYAYKTYVINYFDYQMVEEDLDAVYFDEDIKLL